MIQTETRPLQTRAAFLAPEWLESEHDLPVALERFRSRGFNTILVPVFWNGEPLIETTSGGQARREPAAVLRLLEALAESEMSVWLAVDPLSAGEPGSSRLGRLARRHPRWLMKNSAGGAACQADGDLPGLFCWTSLEYRRYLGNLLVSLAEGYPFDGMVFDLRHAPCPTNDPDTWMHLGDSCLSRLRGELGLDLESYLNQPALEQFQIVEGWRCQQLMRFVQNLKARVRRAQTEVLFLLLANLRSLEDAGPPWRACLMRGLFEAVLLDVGTDEFGKHLRELDKLGTVERPVLAVANSEEELRELGPTLAATPASGFVCLDPDQTGGEAEMPASVVEWEAGGALESRPLLAVRAILRHIVDEDIGDEIDTPLRQALSELNPAWATFHLPEAMELQKKLRHMRREVEGIPEPIAREMELAERLLYLAPPPQVES